MMEELRLEDLIETLSSRKKGRINPVLYKNAAKRAFALAADNAGWTASKCGWPDFVIMKDGKIAVVEVKPRGTGGLRTDQIRVTKLLAWHGIPCYRWSPAGGFKRLWPNLESRVRISMLKRKRNELNAITFKRKQAELARKGIIIGYPPREPETVKSPAGG